MDIGNLEMSDLSFATALREEREQEEYFPYLHRLYADCLFREGNFDLAQEQYSFVLQTTSPDDEEYKHSENRIKSILERADDV
jgi:hypothetical protein